MADFNKLFDQLLYLEGGYANHPHDPGGRTAYGLTEETLKRVGGPPPEKVTIDIAREIYRHWYYEKPHIDQLPEPMRTATFLTGVLTGVRRAIFFLQMAVGTTPDGIIGKDTLEMCKRAEAKAFIEKFFLLVYRYLKDLDTFAYFGDGWIRRLILTSYFASKNGVQN